MYGTDYLDSNFEFVGLPAVIQGRNTGHIGLGISDPSQDQSHMRSADRNSRC
ncbi:MAG: hypothetical protein VB128_08995 [Sedimentibacter saalensis]|uniref:hypothetical protein n=1 Tax=Sedimentibacter saalensis TaxID=130788 RepID=UPI002B21A3AF|nr:hypothetical protein [Sedimentibacter saalensis]MEA5095076.1 hypothetical protein [Sedimentibacter saalensis]